MIPGKLIYYEDVDIEMGESPYVKDGEDEHLPMMEHAATSIFTSLLRRGNMGSRDLVMWTAKQEIGGMGPRQPTKEQLDRYFRAATGSGYADADSHTRSNWCGIFAVYCLNEGGISCYWGINPQMNQWGICPIYSEIEVIYGNSGMVGGDVGVAASRSHHFLMEEVVEEYDYVACLEGNGDAPDAQWMGGVLIAKPRTLGAVTWYYRIHY